MSDSIENQINQFTLEQNSSPQVPTFRSKKNKNKILAAVALIMLLAVGAISSFILLGQEQDTRNQASVAQGLVNIKLQKSADCAVGKTCYIDVLVNTGSSNIDALQAKVVFDQNSIGSVDSISFKQSEALNYQRQMPTESGVEISVQGGTNAVGTEKTTTAVAKTADFKEEVSTKTDQGITLQENSKMMPKPMLSLVKNEVSTSKEILLAWTLMNTSVPFNSNGSDYLLGRIEFVAKQTFKSGDSTNNMVVSLDPSFSKATLYKTGQDSLNTPSPLTIALNMEITTERIPCKSDSSCPTGQYCYYEPTPSGVQKFRANAYCKEKVTKPGMCETDADCAKNEYCYQPPMPICPEGKACPQVMPVKSCKEKPVTSVTPTRIACKTNSACPTGQYCYQEPAPICANGKACPTFKAVDSYCKDLETRPGSCRTDADCAKGQTCYQPPMSTCPEGKVCPQVMPAAYCKDTQISSTPTPVVCKEQCPGTDGVLRSCTTPEADGSAQESLCNLAGRVEACGDVTYCCPKAGGTWTSNMSACQIATVSPSKTPTPTPSVPTKTPTPISCAVPDCKNGVLRLMKTQYDASRDYMAGQSCPVYVCEEIATCQYDYSIWSECNYGVQARTMAVSDKVGCSAPVLKRSCDKPCSSDSNCSAGEVCIRKQAPQTTVQEGAKITSMGYCSVKTTPLAYDLNDDGAVNVLDLSVVIKNLFTNNAKADVNKDKTVDIADYSLVLKSLINREFIAY